MEPEQAKPGVLRRMAPWLLACLACAVLLAGIWFAGLCLLARAFVAGYAESDKRIVDGSARTITTFFEATTRGDIAAATSCIANRTLDVSARMAKDPASFSVVRVSDCEGLESFFHHPFVIGAKLTLTNGAVKYGRFRTDVDDNGRWVINAFRIGDAMPEKPNQIGGD